VTKITSRRKGEWLKELFKILDAAPEGGIRAGIAIKKLEDSVTLTPHEQATYSKGDTRFDKIVRFATLICARAGWVLTQNRCWSLTENGRKAIMSYPDPEAFYLEALKRYRIWEAQKNGQMPGKGTQEFGSDETEPDSPPGTEESATVTYEEAQEDAFGEIEQYLRKVIGPYQFQELVADLLIGMGYHVSWKAPPGKDGGVDIFAAADPLGTKPPYLKVQVKRWSQTTDLDTVKAFVASLSPKDVGIFVTTGDFTKPAYDFARHQAQQTITLINLEQFVALWIEFYPKLSDDARQRFTLKPIHFLTLNK
jgi:restriction system protein